jgi:hypothetical protein
MPLIVLHGEWSIKDLIGHLGFWEERVVSLFTTLRMGRKPLPSPELDALNAQVLTRFAQIVCGRNTPPGKKGLPGCFGFDRESHP